MSIFHFSQSGLHSVALFFLVYHTRVVMDSFRFAFFVAFSRKPFTGLSRRCLFTLSFGKTVYELGVSPFLSTLAREFAETCGNTLSSEEDL